MSSKTKESGGLFDKQPGEDVTFGLGSKENQVRGTIKIVERGAAVDKLPDVGDELTFKAVGGHVKKTVKAVHPGEENPIEVERGCRHRKTDYVELTEMREYKIIELEDGREVWPGDE